MENEKKLAVITGADGGMGTEITRAVAMAGYRVIMASCRPWKAEEVRRMLLQEQNDLQLEIREASGTKRLATGNTGTRFGFACFRFGFCRAVIIRECAGKLVDE